MHCLLACLENRRKEASRLAACAVEKSLAVHRVKRGTNSCPQSEGYIERRFAKLIGQFVAGNLWPVTEVSEQRLDNIVVNMETVDLEEPDLDRCEKPSCACNSQVSLTQTVDQLKEGARSVELVMSDVCYYFVCGTKAVKNGEATCEHKHSIR